jgi:hypothetical protein
MMQFSDTIERGSRNRRAMTEHERAAMDAAIKAIGARDESDVSYTGYDLACIWEAARNYEPASACTYEFWIDKRYRCELVAGHFPDTDHRHTFFEGAYVGWKG